MPRRCSAISRAAAASSCARTAARSRLCCALEERQDLGGMSDERDQAGHLPLDLGDRADQARAAGRLRQTDVKTHVEPAGRPRSRSARPRSRPPAPRAVSRLGLGSLGGQHGDADLQSRALIADVMPGGEHGGRGRLEGRLGVGHERAPTASAHGPQMPALAQGDERLAQGRAGDAQLLAQVPLGGQARAGREQPELDRRTEPLHRLLEGRLGAHRREHGLERGRRVKLVGVASGARRARQDRSQALEAAHALPVGDRGVERAPARRRRR